MLLSMRTLLPLLPVVILFSDPISRRVYSSSSLAYLITAGARPRGWYLFFPFPSFFVYLFLFLLLLFFFFLHNRKRTRIATPAHVFTQVLYVYTDVPPKENLVWEPLYIYVYARIGPTHRRREVISPPHPRTMRRIMFYTRRNKWSVQMHFVANVFLYIFFFIFLRINIYIHIMCTRICLCERYFYPIEKRARANSDARADNN